MKRIILSMLLMVLVITLTGCSKPDFTLNQNELNADIVSMTNDDLKEKYDGLTLEYKAIVWTISSTEIFEGINLYGGVRCQLDIDSLDEEVKSHMLLTVSGTMNVQETSLIELSDCSIEQIHTEIDHELDATNANDDLFYDVFEVVEITGVVTSVFNHIITLEITEDDDLMIAFIEGFNLQSYALGTEVVIKAVWSGEYFTGYEIE